MSDPLSSVKPATQPASPSSNTSTAPQVNSSLLEKLDEVPLKEELPLTPNKLSTDTNLTVDKGFAAVCSLLIAGALIGAMLTGAGVMPSNQFGTLFTIAAAVGAGAGGMVLKGAIEKTKYLTAQKEGNVEDAEVKALRNSTQAIGQILACGTLVGVPFVLAQKYMEGATAQVPSYQTLS